MHGSRALALTIFLGLWGAGFSLSSSWPAWAGDAAAAETPVSCADGQDARDTVMAYLRAMHEHRFEDAWDRVTTTMTDGQARADWAERQRALYVPAKVEIYGVDIRGVYAPVDDAGCERGATVSNVLSSRDKLNEFGNVEFEIYHLVRDTDGWRIDAQESLFDDVAIRRWFPEAGAYATEAE